MSFNRWNALNLFLRASQEERLLLSFERIEEIVGEPLPGPFRIYAQPWQNQLVFPRVAGYRPSFAKVPAGHIAFVRMAPGEDPKPVRRKKALEVPQAGSQWRPLIDHLAKHARPRLLLEIGEIAEIIGRQIPTAESNSERFWTDPNRPWAEAGFRAIVRGLPPGMVAFENPRKWESPAPMVATGPARKPTRHAAVLVLAGAGVSPFSAPAREFFCSPEFLAGRTIAESLDCPWYILSPLYGMLDPEVPVAPHPVHLAKLAFGSSANQRKRFVADLQNLLGALTGAEIALHSDEDTRRILGALLGPLGARVVPLES